MSKFMFRLPAIVLIIFFVISVQGEEVSRIPEKRPGAAALFEVQRGGKWGFINTKGETVISPRFDNVGDYFEGFATAFLGGKWGFIDTLGTARITFQFDQADRFSEGVAPVRVGRKWGYIDPTGKFVIAPLYQRSYPFVGEVARVEFWSNVICDGFPGKRVYTNVTAPESVFLLSDDLHSGCDFVDRRYGYINKEGKLIIAADYSYAADFAEGVAAIRLKDKWGYINKTGIVVIQPQFDSAGNFAEGKAAIRTGSLYGYIDHRGLRVISPQFGFARSFSDGLAAVEINDQWGFIDATGRVVIQMQFSSALDFSDGLAPIALPGTRCGYSDRAGKLWMLARPCRTWRFMHGIAPVDFGSGIEYVNKAGQTIAIHAQP